MDTSKAVTHIGLCAGYGGIELGLKRAIPSLRSVALCEIEAFAIANLVSKMETGLMDPAPIWPDLKTFPWAAFCDRVDILTGGYPCQPFSAAGQRRGKDDPRHLWPYIADGIRLLKPRCCFFENVEGHISLGLSDVIEDLAGMGYRTTWGIFSASECGAPHQRKRVFIMAVASGFRGGSGLSGLFPRHEGQSGESENGSGQTAWPSRPGEQQYGWEPPRVVADSHRLDRSAQTEGREHDRQAGPAGKELGNTKSSRAHGTAAPMAGEEHQEEGGEPQARDIGQAAWNDGDGAEEKLGQTQPALGGDTDGSASGLDYAELCVSGDNRTDELRLLGNGVVPATAEQAFRILIKELDDLDNNR
jgi:DNA (cytosine-5)-methyltransferase 1